MLVGGGVVAAAGAPPHAVFAKRAMAFSPASTVTLSVSVAPSGPLNFTVCAPGSTRIGSEQRRRPDLVAVDGDLGAGDRGDLDPSELRVGLVQAVVGVGALLVGDVLAVGQELLEVVLRLERVSALQAAPREVEEHGRMLLERIGLEERGPRLLELALVVEADALLEPGARQPPSSDRRWRRFARARA